jgi:hypothetical protein
MKRNFSGQPRPDTLERMRSLPIQAEPVMETAIDRLDHLAKTRQPATPGA